MPSPPLSAWAHLGRRVLGLPSRAQRGLPRHRGHPRGAAKMQSGSQASGLRPGCPTPSRASCCWLCVAWRIRRRPGNPAGHLRRALRRRSQPAGLRCSAGSRAAARAGRRRSAGSGCESSALRWPDRPTFGTWARRRACCARQLRSPRAPSGRCRPPGLRSERPRQPSLEPLGTQARRRPPWSTWQRSSPSEAAAGFASLCGPRSRRCQARPGALG